MRSFRFRSNCTIANIFIYIRLFLDGFIEFPPIVVESSLIAVTHIEHKIKVRSTDEEPFDVDQYDSNARNVMLDMQRTIPEYTYTTNLNNILQTFIIIDDSAGDPSFTRKHQIRHALYVRGMHALISIL